MDDSLATGSLSRSRLAEEIRKSGLRVTLPRLEILALLAELGGHHSADAIHQGLGKRGVHLPRASVYNAMRDFVRRGLVQQADAGAGSAYYEHATNPHHHFVCRHCGAIEDVPCTVGDRPCLQAILPGHLIEEAQIIFRGTCPNCRDRGETVNQD